MMFAAKRKAIRTASGRHPSRDPGRGPSRAAVRSQPQVPTLSAAIARVARPPALVAPTVLGDLIAPNPNEARSAIPPRERIYPDYHASPAEIVSVTIVPADAYGALAVPAKIPRAPKTGARPLFRRGAQSLSTALSALAAMGALVLCVSPQLDGVQEPLRQVLASSRVAVQSRLENGAQSLAGMVAGSGAAEKQREQLQMAAEPVVAAVEPKMTVAAPAISPGEPRLAAAEVSMRASLLNEPRMMMMSASVGTAAPALLASKTDAAAAAHVPLAGIWTTVTAPEAVAKKAALPVAQAMPQAAAKPTPLPVVKAAPQNAQHTHPAQGVTAVASTVPPAKKIAKVDALPWANTPAHAETVANGGTLEGVRNAANTRRSLGVTQGEKPSRGQAGRVPTNEADWARSLGDAHR
jgi:hypothetical protein